MNRQHIPGGEDSEQPDDLLYEPPAGFFRRSVHLAGPYFTSEERWMACALLAGRHRADLDADRHPGPAQCVEPRFLQRAGKPRLERLHRPDGACSRCWCRRDDGHRGLSGLCQAVAAAALAPLADRRAWSSSGSRTARHYQLNFIDSGIDNPDQRISENTKHATEMAVEFGLGIFNKTITLVSFIGILWTVSGALDVTFGNAVVPHPRLHGFRRAALCRYRLGPDLFCRPADRRRQHAARTRARRITASPWCGLRENSEAVALIRGEADEKKVLTGYFGDVLASTIGLMRTQRRLMWLTSFYAQCRHGLSDPGGEPALFRRRDHAWAC